MGKKIRRGIFYSIGFFLGCLTLILGIGAWFYYYFPSKWVSDQIETSIRKKTGWNLKIGQLSPFPLGTFSVKQVSFLSPTGDPLFSLEEFTIFYKVLPLLSQKITIGEISISKPEIFLKKENGEWNFVQLQKLFPQKEPSPPSPFAKIDYNNTPLNKIWSEAEKILIEETKDLPQFTLKKFVIDQLKIHIDDIQGTTIHSPPIQIEAQFALTQKDRKGMLRINARENSVIKVNHDDFPCHIDVHVNWPGDQTAKGSLLVQAVSSSIESSFDLNLDQGIVSLKGPNVVVPDLVKMTSSSKLIGWGLQKLTSAISLNLEPGPIPQPWNKFSPRHLPFRTLPKINASFAISGKFLVSTLSELKQSVQKSHLPLEMNISAKVIGQEIPPQLLPKGAEIHAFSGELQTKTQEKDFVISSSFSMSRLALPHDLTGGTKLQELDLFHEGQLHIKKDLRQIEIPKMSLTIPTLGLTTTISGELSSTIAFPDLAQSLKTEKTGLKKMREALSTHLKAEAQIQAPKISNLVKGASLAGEMTGKFEIKKFRSNEVDLILEGQANGFSMNLDNGNKIEDLSFYLPIEKKIYLGPDIKTLSHTPNAELWTKAYSSNLRSLSPFMNALKIAKILTPKLTLEKIQMDAGFDGTNLVIDHFWANLLAGSIWGKMTVLPKGENLELSSNFEAAQLDLSYLTGIGEKGDAKVSVDAQMSLALAPERSLSAEGLLDDLTLQFHLTRIGDQTLDRLISYMDPKGENPSMVQARALIRNKSVAGALKNPKVSFSVSHGMMDADIVLPQVKFVDLTIPIRGISIKNLLRLAGVRKSISSFIPLLESIKYIRLQGVDDNGNLVFSKGREKP